MDLQHALDVHHCPKHWTLDQDGRLTALVKRDREFLLVFVLILILSNEFLLFLKGYCHPGYNSSNGLEPCSPCPSCHFNDEYRQTSCMVCTAVHIDNGTVGCFQSESDLQSEQIYFNFLF